MSRQWRKLERTDACWKKDGGHCGIMIVMRWRSNWRRRTPSKPCNDVHHSVVYNRRAATVNNTSFRRRYGSVTLRWAVWMVGGRAMSRSDTTGCCWHEFHAPTSIILCDNTRAHAQPERTHLGHRRLLSVLLAPAESVLRGLAQCRFYKFTIFEGKRRRSVSGLVCQAWAKKRCLKQL